MPICELYHDNFQNYKCYGIPHAQLVIADIPYNIGSNAYASNPVWYNGGDNKNGESKLAKKNFFNTDGRFKIAEYKDCNECPVYKNNTCSMIGFDDYSTKSIEETVSKAEQWAKDNPVKTRQSEFLKMFPNAKTMGGVIAICPNDIDSTYRNMEYCDHSFCEECAKKYWNEEVADND